MICLSGTGWPALPVLHRWIPTTINYREGYQMKICKKCGSTEKNKSGRCKPCESQRAKLRRAKDPEKARAKCAEWRAKNKEKISEYNALWNSENRDKKLAGIAKWRKLNVLHIKEYDAKRRVEHRDKLLARNKDWVKNNPEKAKESRERWKSANPGKQRIQSQNRRAKKRAVGGKLSPNLSDRLFKLQKGKCACCGKDLGNDFHLDHIMPLALGGANEDWNIQLLRKMCNSQKYKKHPIEFMQSKGFLL